MYVLAFGSGMLKTSTLRAFGFTFGRWGLLFLLPLVNLVVSTVHRTWIWIYISNQTYINIYMYRSCFTVWLKRNGLYDTFYRLKKTNWFWAMGHCGPIFFFYCYLSSNSEDRVSSLGHKTFQICKNYIFFSSVRNRTCFVNSDLKWASCQTSAYVYCRDKRTRNPNQPHLSECISGSVWLVRFSYSGC